MSLNHRQDYNREIRNWLFKNFKYAEYLSGQKLLKRNCPVCGSPNHDFYADNDYLDYVRCTACSLLFMNPAPDAASVNKGFKGADELVAEYFGMMKKYKSAVPDEKPNPEQDLKLKDIYRFKKSGSLLDLGCSVGDFLHKAKHFYEVEGIEVNPLTAEVASKHFKVHTDYLENLKLDKTYGVVTLHQILYGVPNPVSLLKEIHKILKPDGLLYVNTPNSDSYAMEFFKGKANHLYGYTSLNVFNRKSLETLTELTGFKVKSFRTEWLDVYAADMMVFFDDRENFIHKRNTHIPGYEEMIKSEDELHRRLYTELGDRGNYLVSVLEKA